MKLIKTIIAFTIFILIMVIANAVFSEDTGTISSSDTTDLTEEVVFPHDEVVDINITIDEDDYQYLLNNAMDEVYVMCDITYNGYTLNSVAIRAKGNSSLRDVFNSGSDRFSFKVDLNYFISDQDLFGVEKLNLNNLFSDPTMMAEYIGYEMFDALDAVSSRTTYAALYINDSYYGLYLSVEDVNDEFLDVNYDDSDGYLYKPEMGTGSDLAYVSDDSTDYTGLFPENETSYSNDSIAELISAIDNNENLDDIFNVDQYLKYLAISTYTVHLDSYQGSMFHNYYLYDNNGIFECIPWDLNMIFNGFPGASLTDDQAVSFLIDEPVTGALSKYPLVEAVLSNDTYLETYHEYLQELIDGYCDDDTFTTRVLEIYDMIKSYVQADENSFYTYQAFETSLFSDTSSGLISFIEARNENVESQLSGDIVSTNNGLGNVSSTTGQTIPGRTPPVGVPNNNQNTGIDDVVNVTDVDVDYTETIVSIIIGVLGIIGASYIIINKRF